MSIITAAMPPMVPFKKLGPILPTGYLIENMIFDPVTNAYWSVLTNVAHQCIALATGPAPEGPWTIQNEQLITAGGGLNWAPHLMIYNGRYYIWYGHGDNHGIHLQTADAVTGPYGNDTLALPSGPGGSWDGGRILEPYVFQRTDGVWIMLYMGDNLLEQVGYATATSPDGPWTKYANNPFIPNSPGTFDAGACGDPHHLLLNGVDMIFYACGPNTDRTKPWVTAVATTDDWVSIKKQGVVLQPSFDGGFDYTCAFRGAITPVGTDYYFPYTGSWGSTYQPGLAKMRV